MREVFLRPPHASRITHLTSHAPPLHRPAPVRQSASPARRAARGGRAVRDARLRALRVDGPGAVPGAQGGARRAPGAPALRAQGERHARAATRDRGRGLRVRRRIAGRGRAPAPTRHRRLAHPLHHHEPQHGRAGDGGGLGRAPQHRRRRAARRVRAAAPGRRGVPPVQHGRGRRPPPARGDGRQGGQVRDPARAGRARGRGGGTARTPRRRHPPARGLGRGGAGPSVARRRGPFSISSRSSPTSGSSTRAVA